MTLPVDYLAYEVTYSNGEYQSQIINKPLDDLPPGDVIIKVRYSSLNYKDAMSARGLPGVTKSYPHVPGIDAAGVVLESNDDRFREGDRVLVTGYDLGVNTDGGLAELIRVPSDWIVPLPEHLSLKECMTIGTAGFTAGLSLYHLEANSVRPDSGDIIVSGATGGVGTIAVMLLSSLGYTVWASTGKENRYSYLRELGVKGIINRDELDDRSNKPLLPARWAGGIDTVGGNALSTIIRSTQVNGSVTSCGVVAGNELNLTVYPFILRGVKLLGVSASLCPKGLRTELWRRFAAEWKLKGLERVETVISLYQVDDYFDRLLNGTNVGRVVVDLEDQGL